MTRYGAFLRAVNVGGTGKLPMHDLKSICENIGAQDVKTYIASGNVALNSALDAPELAARLEAGLESYAGKPVGVFVRTHAELLGIVVGNPFGDAAGNKVTATLLNDPAELALGAGVKGQGNEQIIAGAGALYVYYPSGMGSSKLRIPGASGGTARNMNTIAKMAAMTAV